MRKTIGKISDVAWTLYDFATLPVSAVISVGTGEVERTIDIMDDLETRIGRLADGVQERREQRKKESADAATKESDDSAVQ